MNSSFNEANALKLLARSNEFAFKEIYDHYSSNIYHVAKKYLRSQELASDLVQEVFITVWQKREHLHEVTHFNAYLYSITKHLAIKYLKKMAKEVLTAREYSEREVSMGNNINQYEGLLHQVVDQLPPKRKQVFNLIKIEGLSYADVAKQLNISTHTVDTHMKKAIQFIRHRLT